MKKQTKHIHTECEHKNLHYCKSCNVVWCEDCTVQWYPSTLTYAYPQTWIQPNGTGDFIPVTNTIQPHNH